MEDFYCQRVLSRLEPIQVVRETDKVLIFHHTKPSWSLHLVAIPKQHVLDLTDTSSDIIKELFEEMEKVIKDFKLNEIGYKVVTNGGVFQDTKHLHFHILSGKSIK